MPSDTRHIFYMIKANFIDMKNLNERGPKQNARGQKIKKTQNSSTRKMDELQKEADDTTQARKPGSQSNSSKQHNNGRGGGK
jgi:hypothetical protein